MTMVDNNPLKDKLKDRPGTDLAKADDRPRSLAETIRVMIDTQSTAFRAVLPAGFDSERFSRLVLTAVKASPELSQCFGTVEGQTSVLLAAMQAAATGLEPNTPTQDCWLLPRRRGQVMECELSIGYRGWLKLARRSGTIKTIFAEVVREKDHFTWSRGLEDDVLEHDPFEGDGDPGELVYAYAIARYKEGGYSFIVLNRKQVEARRAMSESWKNERARPYSPWTKWPDAMWRKSALRALVPYLELTTETASALEKDEVRLRFNEDDGVIDIDEDPAGELPAAPAAVAPPVDEKPAAEDGVNWVPARFDQLPGEWKNEAQRARRAQKLPTPTSSMTAEQIDAWNEILTTQEANWLRKARSDLGMKSRDMGLSDDERHAFVAWVTGGVAAGLSECDLPTLAVVEQRLAELDAGGIDMVCDADGAVTFTEKGNS